MYIRLFSCVLVGIILGHIPTLSAKENNRSDNPFLKEVSTATTQSKDPPASNDVPISMANLEGEPSAFIHQCVNVISGQFCDSQIDLIAHHGVEPLLVERSFFGTTAQKGKLGPGWTINHASKLIDIPSPRTLIKIIDGTFIVEEDNGCRFKFIKYPLDKANPQPYQVSVECLKKGVTNTATGYISGQTNLRNLKVPIPEGKVYRMQSGSGGIKEYHRDSNGYSDGLLLREIKPNGNVVSYTYPNNFLDSFVHIPGSLPFEVSLLNSSNKTTNSLSYVRMNPTLIDKEHPTHEISTKDGRWVRYNFGEGHKGKYILEKVERSDAPTEEYAYYYFNKQVGELETIWKKKLPNGRYVEADYYDLNSNPVAGIGVNIKNADDPRIYRVKKLMAPAGTDRTPITIYQFIYQINQKEKEKHVKREISNGYCDVYNAHGLHSQYGFDENQRLLYVDKYKANDTRYTRELLYWGAMDSKDATQLLARTLEKEDKTLAFARTYLYDNFGNVLQDALYGNLSGENKQAPEMAGNGVAINNGCECYCKNCVYSKDGFNLLLEENDGIQKTAYKYAPGSSRLIAKFKGTNNGWLQRWFYSYNDDAALTQEIVDDGTSEQRDNLTGVTERHITNYTQSQNYPVAFPLVIEEKCLDLSSGEELLVRKLVNTYNNLAKIKSQEHYDSQNVLTHSLSWDHDRMGNIKEEIDAMGRITTRKFDENGNCTFEQGPAPGFHVVREYDFMNRLISEKEIHDDKVNLSLSHRYDYTGNRLATIDQYGNETAFEHDPFGRITGITYPQVFDETGQVIRPKILKSYDVMGNATSETDARGYETKKVHTLRGQLSAIAYPDGTSEKKVYQLNGFLKEAIARNGIVTKFTNDSFGRPILTETYTHKGERLTITSATYNAFHVLTETDAIGIVTQYSYYPDGKLKSRQKEDSLTTYTYDTKGRVAATTEWHGNGSEDVVVKTKQYDLLDRVTEERVEDGQGEILTVIAYEYDPAGNMHMMTTTHKNNALATTTTKYDSHGTPLLATDAEGNQTITKCSYNHLNAMGQYVPYQEITDALGNTTTIEKDAIGRTLTTQRKNAFGKIIQKQENRYDANGNHCLICDTIFSDDAEPKAVLTKMSYDSSNRLFACYEAQGRPEQKVTKITYNNFGQKKELIKNDGVVLTHTYDDLGRLKTMHSSDKTVHYKYHYDLNNNPELVEDLVHNTSTLKKFDTQNRMKSELQSHDLELKFEYDRLSRPIRVTLPDNSAIAYSYHASLLKTVSRLDIFGNPLYEHRYDEFDKSGHLISSTLPGQAGTINYQYDLLGRLTEATAPQWQETLSHYDAVGNLLEKHLKDFIGDTPSSYAYNDLYQLTSEEGIAKHAYTYDSHYNRLSKDGRTHSYNDLHQLLDDGIYHYTYNLNGNMKSKISSTAIFSYNYDALDRLIELINGNEKVGYAYDESNRRLSKTFYTLDNGIWKPNQTERYLYQGQNEIGACDTAGRITQLRLLGNGKGAEIGAAVAIEIGNSTYVPVHDHNGNVGCLLSLSGELLETYRYSAYGEELFDEALIPWRFASKRFDAESGFVYFGRRYYDPSIGRWVTPDPIGREGGPNLYAYVLNNPLSHFDLYGLSEGDGAFGNFLESLFGKVVEVCATVLNLTGKAVAMTAHHLVPIPYLKDVLEFGGHCIAGEPEKFKPWENRSGLIVHDGYGDADPHRRYVTFNGICCTREDCENRAAALSHAYGGINVYCIYNGTNGFLLDTLEVMCQKLCIPTRAQASAEYETARLAKEMGSHGIFLVDAHSQGCETVHNLSGGLRKMMHVNAFGPARVLQNGDFASAHNYLCPLDIVTPLADPWGLMNGKANISYVTPRGNPFSTHGFEKPTYAGIVEFNGFLFKNTWGSVE